MPKLTFLSTLANLFITNAYAEGKVTTATATTGDAQKFTDGVRVVYSKEIEFKAQPNMKFMQFASIKTELGVDPGLTISMLTYDNLAMGGALTELVNMTTQAISGSMKQITVTEYGNAVSASEKLIVSSFDDIMARTTTLLSRDYAKVVDCLLRDSALSTVGGTSVVYASKKDGTAVTARTGLTSECTLKVSTIKDCLEILATENAPQYNGQDWICFVHPHQSRGLRDDPAWINASNYGAPQHMFTGEIGRIDNTRFIETTLMPNGKAPVGGDGYFADLVSGTAGNLTDVYKAVVFGDAYYAIAFSLPVELRDNGVEDFGRKRSLAWYGIFGTGKLHPNYGVIIETS
jgi:N4-gp56 family major capsid protein